MKICIDPGHGGKDPGSFGNGIVEKQVTLRAALLLQAELKRLEIPSYITRTEDTHTPEGYRINAVNSELPDLAILLHCNSSPSPLPGGVQIAFYDMSIKSAVISEALYPHLVEVYGKSDWNAIVPVKFYELRMLNVAAIMVLMGYVTNENDVSLLQSEWYLKELMKALR